MASIKKRIKSILGGIVNVEEEYPIDEYSIDMYIPDCAIGIEIDGDEHKHYTNDELRQERIQNRLGCKFLRIKKSDSFDKKINELLHLIIK